MTEIAQGSVRTVDLRGGDVDLTTDPSLIATFVAKDVLALSVKDHGAKCNGQTVFDGSMTSGSAVLTTAHVFTAADVGKQIAVERCGTALATLVTTIQSVTAGVATLAATAGGTQGSAQVVWGTDDTAAVNSTLAMALSLAALLPIRVDIPGWSICVGQLTAPLPNDSANPPHQTPVVVQGRGAYFTGSWSEKLKDGAVLDLWYNGAGVAKIDTRGRGTLLFLDLNVADHGWGNLPFCQTTGTTVIAERCAFWGNMGKSGLTCDQDVFVFGGTSQLTDGSANAAFQGYGSYVKHCYFSRIRRGGWARQYANSIKFSENTFSASCGCKGFMGTDGVTNGTTTFGSASTTFTAAMVNATIMIAGAGTAGADFTTTIASVAGGVATLTDVPPTNVAAAKWVASAAAVEFLGQPGNFNYGGKCRDNLFETSHYYFTYQAIYSQSNVLGGEFWDQGADVSAYVHLGTQAWFNEIDFEYMGALAAGQSYVLDHTGTPGLVAAQTNLIRVGNQTAAGAPFTTFPSKLSLQGGAQALGTSGFTFLHDKGSARTVTDGVLNTTTTITSATAAFAAADVNRLVTGAGIPANTVISSVTNATTAVLSQAATATASGVTLTIDPEVASFKLSGQTGIQASGNFNALGTDNKFGPATNQLDIGSLGTTDVWIDSQGSNTNINLNLRAKGTGQINLRNDINVTAGKNFVFDTATGTKFGAATNQKLAFYGATAIAQRAGAAQAQVATTAATNVAPYGFSQAQADGIITLLNEIQASLVVLGLIKGSA